MRYCIVLLMLLASCAKPTTQQPIVIHDTVYLPPTKVICDTAYIPVVEVDTVFISNKNDSLIRRLNTATYKLARVKYYLRICNRNPSQDKFLRGWLNRAVN